MSIKGINLMTFSGRLGADPEYKETANTKLLSMSVAIPGRAEKGKDQQPEWTRVTVFGKTAEACSKYLKKGSMVLGHGRLQTDSYEKDGVKRYSTKIIANNVVFMDPAPKKRETSNEEYDFGVGDDDITF